MAFLRKPRSMLPCMLQYVRNQPQQAFAGISDKPSTLQTTKQQADSKDKRNNTGSEGSEEWTEVIHEKSGQTYYWNQKTGETTDLGEPRPTTKFKDSNWEQAASGSSGPFQEGWREPPGKDYTYFYSLIGTGIGIAVGWATQYMH